jgi:zinc protease
LEDLQQATLEDVREFYERFYVPANATLVIAGDIDFEETRALVDKWFGEIKAGAPVEDMKPMPVQLKASKRVFHLDSFAKTAELRLTYPTVEQYHADAYALEALGQILADGKKAPLFTTVVQEAKQSSGVSAYQDSGELAGTFTIRVRANPGVDLDDAYASVQQALERFESEGVRKTDLQRFQAQRETRFYGEISDVLDRVLQLGISQEFADDPAYAQKELSAIRKLKVEDIERVYRRYIQDRPAIISSFVPKDAPALVLEGSVRAKVIEEPIVAGAEKEFEESDSDDFERTPSKHDRSEPPLGPALEIRVPDSWSFQLANGVSVVGMEHAELPMVEFSLRLEGGQRLDKPERLGTAHLVAEMLNEGTRNKTPTELQDAIELLGSSLYVWHEGTSMHIAGRTQSAKFDDTMQLLTEMLLEPRWDASEFERLKARRLAKIEERAGNARSVADLAFRRQLYGESHVGGQPLGGSAETVASIGLHDLKSWYQESLSPRNATMHVVGDIRPSQVGEALSQLGRGWKGEALALPTLPETDESSATRLFFVDMPGAKQSVIFMGRKAMRGDDPRFYRATVANNRLGSGSSARLTQKLRIEKGYTYGASSQIERAPYQGAFIARSQVRSNVTLESLEIFKDLLGNYAATFGESDLATTKNLIAKGDSRRFESLGALVRVLETMTEFGLEKDYIQRQQRELSALSLEEVHQLIGEIVDMNRMTIVVVGDAKTQLPRLRARDYGEPIVLDREGKRIGGK